MDPRTLRVLEYDKIVAQLARLAFSEGGRALCSALTPSVSAEAVVETLAETTDALAVIMEKGEPPLSGITEIAPSVDRAAAGATLTCGELLRIGTFLRTVDRMLGMLPERPSANFPADNRVYAAIGRLKPDRNLEKTLTAAVAGEDELFDNASPELAGIRRRIRESQAEVKESLGRIVRSPQYARALQESLVTMRGDRYVVPVKSEHRGDVPGIVHDASSSGATLFVEPMAVVEANNRIRELMVKERDEVDRILRRLSGLVAGSADLLSHDARLLARIDFLTAKGRLSLLQDATPPEINTRGRIRLKSARHPLIPKERVVPIDFAIGDGYDTLVVTGPNTGGKTVSLKSCGLFTLMAMSGLHIPARYGSEIAVFQQVLADIGDEQSIEQDLSTFSSHMRTLVRITEAAGPSCLVLVDELGSGTDPSEGAALAMAVLDHLRAKGCTTLATTHYKELKGYALRTEGVENACCEFDTETLRPTYRILIGVPGVSNAFIISSRLGLSAEIIAKARTLLSEEGIAFEELVERLERSRVEAERALRDAELLHAQARQDTEKAAELRRQLEEKRNTILSKAREEAREWLADAVGEVDAVLVSLKEAIQTEDAREAKTLADGMRRNLRARLSGIEEEIGRATLDNAPGEGVPDRLVVGQDYYAPALDMTGRLASAPDARGNCILTNGSLRVNVPAASLRLPGQRQVKPQKGGRAAGVAQRSGNGDLTMSRRMTMNNEIQLLGMTVDEATQTLDRYLDDAVLANIATVRIVHGKGTGALRSAVQSMLKSDRRVRKFRAGAYGEGDSGVTIAEL